MANNRLPFGLCKKYGIDLPDDATPKDAWDALKENGIEFVEDEEPTVVEPSDVIDDNGYDHTAKGNKDETSGAISGAIDPNSERGQAHANRYYESIRKRKDDVPSIARNTGFSEDDIKRIKDYIFIDEHDLETGRSRFDPSCYMAHSWQRLIEGKIEPEDIVLLQHELAEIELTAQGLSQAEAHLLASRKFNYDLMIRQKRKGK